MTRSRPQLVVIALVAVAVLVPAGAVVAQTSFLGTSTNEVHLQAPTGPNVTTTDADFGSNVPIRDGLVDLGHTEFSGSGEVSAANFDKTYLSLDGLNAPNGLTVDGNRPRVTFSGAAESLGYRDWSLGDGLAAIQATLDQGQEVTISGIDVPTDTYIVLRNVTSGELHAVDFSDATGDVQLTISESGDYEIDSISGEGIFTSESPADGTSLDNISDVKLSVTVEELLGESRVNFYDASDDSLIDFVTLNQPGTASVIWEDTAVGTNEWYVTLGSDDRVQSETFSFGTAGVLEIRDELSDARLDGVNFDVEVRFFNGEALLERTATDGTVDLSGLPADEQFVADIDPQDSNWTERTVYIPDVEQQNTAYILNTSEADTSLATFVLEDNSGVFVGDASTRLIVEKPFESTDKGTINLDYRRILGDRFGANNRVSTVLEKGQRYRLSIETDSGRQRVLGDYRPEANQEQTLLEIDEFEFDLAEVDQGVEWDVQFTNASGQEYIKVLLNDGEELTENVQVTITPAEGEPYNTTILDDEFRGPYGELSITQPIPANATNVSSWVVEWSADRDNETVSAQTVTGQGSYPVPVPGDGQLIGLLSAGLIVFVAGMFSVRIASLGAIVVPVVAVGLWVVGWLPLPLTWILAALALGVSTEFGLRGGIN